MKKTKVRNNIMVEISRINVYPVNGETIKANGNIGFNDAIVVAFKIIKSKKGELFVTFPSHSYEDNDGVTQYVNDVYFVDGSLREFVTESIIKAYHDEVDEKPAKRSYKRK